jgi:hypothetical protein
MARVWGTSGAWRTFCDNLWKYDIWIERPDQIGSLLDHLQKNREEIIDRKLKKWCKKRESTLKRIKALEAEYQAAIIRKRNDSADACRAITAQINTIQSERGILKLAVNLFRIAQLKRVARRIKRDERESIIQINKHRELPRHQKQLQEIKDEQALDIERLDRGIRLLKEASCSQEFAGAQAELVVSDILTRLPDDFCVFHDVRLRARRFIRFQGRGLKSAQIDHIVLGPTGIFVIETKNWSRRTSESAEYFSPFEQVSRASYLCYDLLCEIIPEVRVKSLIVKLNSLPKRPPGSKVTVLSKHQLCRHLVSSKNSQLRKAEIEAIRSRLIDFSR